MDQSERRLDGAADSGRRGGVLSVRRKIHARGAGGQRSAGAKPIKELLDELDPDHFWQIHRSTIVNALTIAGVVRGLRDQADLKLKTRPETLTVSRNFTHLFKQM